MVNSARSLTVILVAMLVVLVSSEQVQAQRRQSKKSDARSSELSRRNRFKDKLKVGDKAPNFTLKKLNSKKKETVTLSGFQGKKPVVLVFGSYT